MELVFSGGEGQIQLDLDSVFVETLTSLNCSIELNGCTLSIGCPEDSMVFSLAYRLGNQSRVQAKRIKRRTGKHIQSIEYVSKSGRQKRILVPVDYYVIA